MSPHVQANVTERSADRSSRWAPWWIYVLLIVPANLGKEQFLPGDAAWWIRAGLTATIVVGGIALVTAVYRATRNARLP